MRSPTPPPPATCDVPYTTTLPAPIVFRTAHIPPQASYPRHRHPWGEFTYSFSGVIEVRLDQQDYLAPPHYGVWCPPNVEHRGSTRQETLHSSLYVSAELCDCMPQTTCTLAVSPLVRAMLEHLRQHPHALPPTESEQRLMRVLVDQLSQADRVSTYLPQADDPTLQAILNALEAHPGDDRSVAELARAFHTTERTLIRRCQRDLGMTLSDWRQRLRIVKALPRLDAGEKVETIALDLGYANASAFITMFRRLTGTTPAQLRTRVNGPETYPAGTTSR